MKAQRILSFSGLVLLTIFTHLSAQVTFTYNNTMLQSGSPGWSPCVVDMNGDYLDDVVRISQNSMTIDYQGPNGTYTQTFFPMTLAVTPDWSIAAGDIDDNGFNDLLMGGGSAVSFLYADSMGTSYSEVVHPQYIFSQRSTFADINNDGALDAFVCHDIDQSHPYRNDGNGNLSMDTSLINTRDMPGNYAAIWVDYDNDRDIDLYITKCRLGSQPGDVERTNLLYRNDGAGNYTEWADSVGLADNSQSWATTFEDFDNDGDMDAFTVNHDFINLLYENDGTGHFTNVISGSGIDSVDLGAWECMAGDFDNDGNMDIYSELQNEMYWGHGDMTFTGESMSFSGGAIGDLNDDGFLDVLVGSAIQVNNGNNNNWVKITLEGVVSNWNGIGARVELHGAWGMQIRDVRSGQSFSPMSTLNTHFGIGTATAIDSIVVRWPSGIVRSVPNPAINSTHHVIEVPPLAVNEPIPGNRLQLFPNPATNQVEVRVDGQLIGDAALVVYNTAGQIVLEERYNTANRKVLDVALLPKGYYVVEVRSEDQKFSKKLLLQ